MKKVSKSSHHSLGELNITPLLDLAFVLLVIFIITTTPVVNDLELNLPSASSRPKDAPKKPNYVTVNGEGKIYLNTKEVDLISLQQLLVQLRETDPDLSVVVRGDSGINYQRIINVLDILQQANVTKVGLATEPTSSKKAL
ncbi:MAG: exbD2 [Verrucomicrobiales bacterium]|nr:exbD2 [Actinomycetes bacterium]MDB6054995.1 exbD2 [Verrucomicrobiales bacterium]MDB6129587.1 exbD2 [Verrucomicrobiales bacterium]